MSQLVLFPTELICMQLTGVEIDLLHKHYPPSPLPSLSPCRVAYQSAFIVHPTQQTAYNSRSFLIIKVIYQVMKLVR